jgi:putative DNA primase/helicase
VSDHPYDRFLAALTAKGCGVRIGRPGQARARCPSHDDRVASLIVSHAVDRVLVKCHAGCKFRDVIQSIGWREADTFVGPRPTHRQPRQITATYDYLNFAGDLLAQKVRFHPKAFRWRRRDPRNPDRWTWNVRGASVGLYRAPDLIESPQVFVVEGEKAADRLAQLGVVATCGPNGASQWMAEWSVDLWRVGARTLIVLPDNDLPGRQHAERIAESVTSLATSDAIKVKLIELPGLVEGADVFDWLEGHVGLNDLLEIAARASWWQAGAKACERVAKRRRHEGESASIPREATNSSVRNAVTRNAVTRCTYFMGTWHDQIRISVEFELYRMLQRDTVACAAVELQRVK